MIKLGDKVKDKITGFSGIAIGRTDWLTGCTRITVRPDKLSKDGQVMDTQTFDEPELIIIKSAKIKIKETSSTSAKGGPRMDVPKY